MAECEFCLQPKRVRGPGRRADLLLSRPLVFMGFAARCFFQLSVRPFLRADWFPLPFVPEGRAAEAAAGTVERRASHVVTSLFSVCFLQDATMCTRGRDTGHVGNDFMLIFSLL